MNVNFSNYKIYVLIIMAILVSGCSSSRTTNKAQIEVRDNFISGNYEDITAKLSNPESENLYGNNSLVLRDLELAKAYRMSGNYQESNEAFERAELEIERLFGTSVQRNIRAFAVNDGQLEYQGEDYEDIYINLFKSLNYIHKGNLEAAAVEARRMVFKMESVQDRYGDVMEQMSGNEQAAQLNWETGDPLIQNSALGHYLAAVLFNARDRPDNARIEFERLKNAWQDQMGIDPDLYAELSGLHAIGNGNYNVLIVGFAGRAPSKVEHTIEVSINDIYGKLSYPVLNQHQTPVRRMRVVVNENEVVPLYLIEDMSVVASEIFEIRRPMIIARGTIRATLRAAAASRGVSEVESRGGFIAGQLAGVASRFGQDALEVADLRSWQSLPGKAYSNVLQLPAGTHNIRVEYLDTLGNVISENTSQVTVRPESVLEVSEHMHFN